MVKYSALTLVVDARKNKKRKLVWKQQINVPNNQYRVRIVATSKGCVEVAKHAVEISRGSDGMQRRFLSHKYTYKEYNLC